MLTENEIRDKVLNGVLLDWYRISAHQKLSERFIREFKDRIDWYSISRYQQLSEGFMNEFETRVDRQEQLKAFKRKSLKVKREEVKAYAKQWGLKIKKGYLYAYRNHDERGCGNFKYNNFYEKGEYYKDWRCDMNPENENSFGLGIWPKGNTPIRVKIEDWGVAVTRADGKCRVFGFEIIR